MAKGAQSFYHRSISMAAPRRPLPTRIAAALLALFCAQSPLLTSCSRAKSANQADGAAQAIADVDARIRGAWVLERFVPDTPLEPMLQAMLDFQFGRLVVRFDGKRLVADSTGIHVDRAYRISEVTGDQFKLTSFDDQGVPYDSICMFLSDGTVEVHSTTSPWRGVALVRRAGV
jgi:hypothetical protein